MPYQQTDPEIELKNLPQERWRRWHWDAFVNGARDMLNAIKANPNHPFGDAAKSEWEAILSQRIIDREAWMTKNHITSNDY